MVLTITTKDKYKYQVKESIFTNTSEQLWEKRFQENEKYFVLLNPSIGKVLTAHDDMLKIKGMIYTHILWRILWFFINLIFYF